MKFNSKMQKCPRCAGEIVITGFTDWSRPPHDREDQAAYFRDVQMDERRYVVNRRCSHCKFDLDIKVNEEDFNKLRNRMFKFHGDIDRAVRGLNNAVV